MQGILNLNPIAIWCIVGPCDNIFCSLSNYHQRNSPSKNSSAMISTYWAILRKTRRRAEQAARQVWVLWCDTSERGSPSLEQEQEGNLPCLHPLHGYHCQAIPADQLMGWEMDPVQTTAAQNGTPLALTVSAISEYSAQLAPSIYECPLTYPWSHSSIHFLCPTCVREALGITWEFLLFPPWEI